MFWSSVERVIEAFWACLLYKSKRYGLTLPESFNIETSKLRELLRFLKELDRHELVSLATHRHLQWRCNGSDAVIKTIRDHLRTIFEGTPIQDPVLMEIIAEAGALLLLYSESWVDPHKVVKTTPLLPYEQQRARALRTRAQSLGLQLVS